jgi:hypothetical protein
VSERSVTFSFRPSASVDAQKDALNEIRAWAGVVSAAFLKPDARNPEIARMGYVVVSSDANIDEVTAHLSELQTIETASVPATRYLIKRT